MPIPEQWRHRLSAPAIAAPMFMMSNPDLVVACCNAGIIGTFPALNQRDSAGYAAWLDEIVDRIEPDSAPYGVNLSLRRGNPRLDEDMRITIERRVPLVLTSLGIAPDIVERIHGYGGIVLHDVINLRHARKAIAAGVDGLILVCAGAGGHAGQINPFTFVAEVRRIFDGIIVLAGGITDGRQIAAAELLGADMVSIGTRFIATKESGAPAAYKQMIVDAGSADIVYTAAMTGVGASFLMPSMREWGLDAEGSGVVDSATRTVRHDGREGRVWRDVWSAGHAVGAIHDIPDAGELCRRLATDYAAARRR
jgi:nitronate monooxygenase